MSFLRTSLVTLVLASTSFLGCEVTETSEMSENGVALQALARTRLPPGGARVPLTLPRRPPMTDRLGLSNSMYYLARSDTRGCGYPACGGVFVSALNQTSVLCPQGTSEPECYVSDLDFSRFEGSIDGTSTVSEAMGPDFETSRVVLQGTMTPSRAGFGTLYVRMGWIAVDSQRISGQFYGTHNNGIVCVVAPCPSYDQEVLNRGTVIPFHGFDFTDVPAHANDSSLTAPALLSEYGLIVAGVNIIDDAAGPGGSGTFLKASQVFVPLTSLTEGRATPGSDSVPNNE